MRFSGQYAGLQDKTTPFPAVNNQASIPRLDVLSRLLIILHFPSLVLMVLGTFLPVGCIRER